MIAAASIALARSLRSTRSARTVIAVGSTKLFSHLPYASDSAACSSSERSAQLVPLALKRSALVPSASSTTPL
ncbi:MAG TPA: hypothetical protein VN889_07615 [Solirubrobacteraceae bacterium]|nr:hypothetical protein [Solirubrobacteraceae bacterium]